MIQAIVPALVFVAALAGPAPAAFFDGNEFYKDCQRENGQFALGYTVAVVDIMRTGEPHACTHKDVTAGQIRDVVCKFLADNPAERHETAHYLTFLAVSEDFPCNK